MTAMWMWARADLRRRWRSWVVLGLLAGITVGLAAAGVAGARRTANAAPAYARKLGRVDAAVLANDPRFDATERAKVAALPEVQTAMPFSVPFGVEVSQPSGLDMQLVPVAAAADPVLLGVILEGRRPRIAEEAVVDQNTSKQFHLPLGATIVVGQHVTKGDLEGLPPGLVPHVDNPNFTARLRVVGIAKSTSSDASWAVSHLFYDKYGSRILGVVNMFLALKHGQADFDRFQRDVPRALGRPVNVDTSEDFNGQRKLRNETNLERDGLLLFALAVAIGGGVLVGQALVRAVTAGAADLPVWRAIGADRPVVVPALVMPSLLSAVIAAITAGAVAIALSPRFPVGVARRYDLDLGVHADWTVLAIAALATLLVTVATAFAAAAWRTARGEPRHRHSSRTGSWAANAGLPTAMVIGSRLAVEPGRGRNAVPVRSALVGAIAGVLGVTACFTFRAGVSDALSSPERSGIVWDYELGNFAGTFDHAQLAKVANDRDVAAAFDAVWARAVVINGVGTPTFGVQAVKGAIAPVLLQGRAPSSPNEIAFAPTTMRSLGVHVGDDVTVGTKAPRALRVVGEALLPSSSHTEYDQSGWMTLAGLHSVLPPADQLGADDIQDYVLVRWRPGADVAAVSRRVHAIIQPGVQDSTKATLPSTVVDLGRLRVLPLALGVFFALLAAATVAHALVTTVRRRRHDLAVLQSLGFTRRESRLAIAWQSTLLATAGLVVGIPLGVLFGRLIWRSLAHHFPLVYAPPFALIAVVVVVPTAVLVANALAAGPARAAARIAPARVLRTE